MLSVAEAVATVLRHAQLGERELVPLDAAWGRVLAEPVASDIDSPPHDKALMDGYAVRAADVEQGLREFEVLEEITAGLVPTQALRPGAATRIMTGAEIPTGTDAVVMVEQSEPLETDAATSRITRVRLSPVNFRPGQNLMPRGLSMRKGDAVLAVGTRLRAIEVGLLAEVGQAAVSVYRRPVVAVLSTGNELTPAQTYPAHGMIRNSNGPMLAALVREAAADLLDLGIARDERAELADKVRRGLQCDVLVLSGGVSAGVLDLVPAVLRDAGVEAVFHGVAMKPGKPIWFGKQSAGGRDRLVFGLPGNPVSTLACFHLLARPAILRLQGRLDAERPVYRLPLAAEFKHRGDRPTFHPGGLENTDAGPAARPLNWKGSADLRTLAEADLLIHFPPGDRAFAVGDLVAVQSLS